MVFWYWDMTAGFILKAIVIKIIAPIIEETPAKCKEKTVRSTEAPVLARLSARAEYMVPLVPEPASTTGDTSRSKNDGGSSQKFMIYSGKCSIRCPSYLWDKSAFKPCNHNGYSYKENYYKCRDCYDYLTDLGISK